MPNRLRQLYNAIVRLLDRTSILQTIRFTRKLEMEGQPVTAGTAFEVILPAAGKLDRRAQLKRVVSLSGIDAHGSSAHWEFFFNLPGRRAKLLCEWVLPWNEPADTYDPPVMEITVTPFPPPESPLHQLVREGGLLYRQLSGLWREELRRIPNLPRQFHDTDLILQELMDQGLQITQSEFSLTTGHMPEGGAVWRVQTRRGDFHASFA